MIPLIEREVVNRGWLNKQDFIDLFAVTQSLPGIFAVNISIFVGYKLKKITGSIICALGTILPSFFIILAIALCFNLESRYFPRLYRISWNCGWPRIYVLDKR